MSPNQPSIDELMAQRDWVSQVARRLLVDASEADDAAQEALVKATRSPPQLDPERNRVGALRGWLRTVVTNVVRDARRIEARRNRRELAARLRETEPAVLDVVARASSQRRVVEAVMRLQEPYRRTILLRFFDDMQPKQIAEALRIPINTVNSRIQRGMERLRFDLESEFGGDRRRFVLWLLPLTESTVGMVGGLAAWMITHRLAVSVVAILGGFAIRDLVRADGPRPIVVPTERTQLVDESTSDRVKRDAEGPERDPGTESERTVQADEASAWEQYLAHAQVDVELPFSPSAVLLERTGGEEGVTIPGMIQLPRGRVAEDFEVHGLGKERAPMTRFPGAFIDRTEVTRGQYRVFLESNPFGEATAAARERFEVSGSDDRLPVSNIDYSEAKAYARWAFKAVQSYAEWRYAGSAGDARRFPWGDSMRGDLLRHDDRSPIVVGTYSTLAAPFPVADLVGNVAEWTRDQTESPPLQLRSKLWRECYMRTVGGSYVDNIGERDESAFALGNPRDESCDRRAPELGMRCTRMLDPYPDYLREALGETVKVPTDWIDACAGAKGVEVRDFSGEIQTAARVFAFAVLPGWDGAICLIRTNVALRAPLAGSGLLVVRRTAGRYYLYPGVRKDDARAVPLLHELSNENSNGPPRLALDRLGEGRIAIEMNETDELGQIRRLVLPFYVEPKDLVDAKPQIPARDDVTPMLETLRASRVESLTPSKIEWMARAWTSSDPQFLAARDVVEMLKVGLEIPVHANPKPYARDLASFAKLLRVDPESWVAEGRRWIDVIHGTEVGLRFELLQAIEPAPGMRPLLVDLDWANGSKDAPSSVRNYHLIAVPRATAATSWLDRENRMRLFAAIRTTIDSYEADPRRVYLRASGRDAIDALELVRQFPGVFAGCLLERVEGDVQFPPNAVSGFRGRTIVLEQDHACPGIASLRSQSVNVLVAAATIPEFLAEKGSVSRLTSRDPYPAKFTFTTYGRAARCANFVEITRLDSPGSAGATVEVDVVRETNRIMITHGAAIGSLRLWLNDEIVDLDYPVTVTLKRTGQPAKTETYAVARGGLVLLDSLKSGSAANLGALFTAYLDLE